MKHILSMLVVALGLLLLAPGRCLSQGKPDSLVIDRMFAYKRNLAPSVYGVEKDFYLKCTFKTVRRNPTLVLVPSMYAVSRGRRNYIGENIGRIKLRDIDDYDITQQTYHSTIPHNRRAMDVMMRYIVPNLYGETLFDGYLISPFHYDNRAYYRYRISDAGEGRVGVRFTPRVSNTQLVSGVAVVEKLTGRIMQVRIRGEHDMVAFEVSAQMGDGDTPYALLPRYCDSRATFKFAGNEMRTRYYVNFDCDTTVPDSLSHLPKAELIGWLRPDSLDNSEKDILKEYFAARAATPDTVVAPKRETHAKKMMDRAWDIVADHVLSSQRLSNERASFRLSPLFDPLEFSYSGSRGLSYKIDINTRYIMSGHSYVTLNPRLGYNFKIKKFFFNAPLRYTFDERHRGWVELRWANGNRITNSSVLDMIREQGRDTVDFSALNLDYFDDEELMLMANYRFSPRVELSVGCVYHERTAVNSAEMESRGQPSVYRSFAPSVKLTLRPIMEGPTFTANYERSVTGVMRSNIEYERWEFDASYKRVMQRLRILNLRVGGGFYTNKSSNYFVDFANFRENYIPGGWEDDWSGEFQLLNSAWYNASQYYVRTNISYDSPLLALTWIPIVGRYIESERIYANLLQIQHTRPYAEVGYSLTNRYFSVGVFASFLNAEFVEFGSKFSFELFRKW